MNYFLKYKKYKSKYLKLKNGMIGGSIPIVGFSEKVISFMDEKRYEVPFVYVNIGCGMRRQYNMGLREEQMEYEYNHQFPPFLQKIVTEKINDKKKFELILILIDPALEENPFILDFCSKKYGPVKKNDDNCYECNNEEKKLKIGIFLFRNFINFEESDRIFSDKRFLSLELQVSSLHQLTDGDYSMTKNLFPDIRENDDSFPEYRDFNELHKIKSLSTDFSVMSSLYNIKKDIDNFCIYLFTTRLGKYLFIGEYVQILPNIVNYVMKTYEKIHSLEFRMFHSVCYTHNFNVSFWEPVTLVANFFVSSDKKHKK